MRWASSSIVVLITLLAAALFSTPKMARAECVAPTADTGFAEILVNIEAGTFSSTLPFDVPIRLCGQVPTGTRSARVRFVSASRKQGPLVVDDECNITSPNTVTWSPDLDARIDGTDARFVLERPLEAQRQYAFCFETDKPLSQEDLDAFRMRASALLDAGLGAITSADLTSAESESLRKKLYDELAALAGPGRVVRVDGTVFKAGAATDKLRGEWNGLVLAVLEPQLRRQRILQGRPATSSTSGTGAPATASFGSLQFDLAQGLNAIRGDGVLTSLASASEMVAATDASWRTLVQSDFARGIALLGLDEAATSALARGQAPESSAAVPLDSTVDPAQAAAAAQTYDALSTNLGALAAFVARATSSQAPAALTGSLTEGDRTALSALAGNGGPLLRAEDLAFTLSGLASNIAANLASRPAALAALVAKLDVESRQVFVGDASTGGTFDTFSTFYVSADAGFVYAMEIDELVPYIGTNLYLRPVNKNAPLKTLGSFGQTFSRRFAFTVALTASSVGETGDGDTVIREDLFASQSLLLGAGLRITDMIRLGAGALVFKEDNPSPLIDELELATTYYLTLSFDLNVARAFQGGFANLFK